MVSVVDVEQDAIVLDVWTITYTLADRHPRTLTVSAPHRDAAVAEAVRELAERYSTPIAERWRP